MSVLWTTAWLLLGLHDVRPLKVRPPQTTAYIELRRREARSRGARLNVRRAWVPYERISQNLREAVVTAEDDGFWRHRGVDWEALKAAVRRDRRQRRLVAGGSTITMQLARNLYLSPSKSPLRKLAEILIALRLERELGKRRILELYLNVVEWGPGLFGCEAAARTYFDKPCSDLSLDEAAAMAAVLPNPRRWNPAKRGPYVERNARRIAARMPGFQSASTTVISSTGSVEIDQGRKPVTFE